jgi:hypothetical protein
MVGIGPNLSGQEHFGYTEPFRRFVQRESFEPQANAIPNEAPSWLPGDDYYTNFHLGDPYVKVDQGSARLPGAGYEAIHPEFQGVDPEEYPDMNKLAILADVAPYSREYNTYRQKVGAQVEGNTEAEIEYGKILKRVKESRESIIRMKERYFTAPVDEISGTVADVSPGGVTLNEYPGRRFQFSSVGTSAADMSAAILGENNQMTRSLRPAQHKHPRARAGNPAAIYTHLPSPNPVAEPQAGLSSAPVYPWKGARYFSTVRFGNMPISASDRGWCFCQ